MFLATQNIVEGFVYDTLSTFLSVTGLGGSFFSSMTMSVSLGGSFFSSVSMSVSFRSWLRSCRLSVVGHFGSCLFGRSCFSSCFGCNLLRSGLLGSIFDGNFLGDCNLSLVLLGFSRARFRLKLINIGLSTGKSALSRLELS